ncbi:MAG: hypothetical protein JW724_07610 [Candidatus Altiarchaeota archaeon]|nr:hypothetical protein [Candidatus Altiarchaeota archaeon]
MKKKINSKGQIGPMSLEDLLPIAIVSIIIFIYIAAIAGSVSGHLQQRSAGTSQDIAAQLSVLLESRSILVHEGNKGLLDAGRLDAITYEELSSLYGFTGYNHSVEVEDLAAGSKWTYEPGKVKENMASVATPVAIRYSPDTVREGLLKVRVWRK